MSEKPRRDIVNADLLPDSDIVFPLDGDPFKGDLEEEFAGIGAHDTTGAITGETAEGVPYSGSKTSGDLKPFSHLGYPKNEDIASSEAA